METTSILGLYGDNGKENGNYYLGFRIIVLPGNSFRGAVGLQGKISFCEQEL